MSSSLAGFLQIVLLVAALAACYKPLGDYIAGIFTSEKHLRPERAFYRLMGIDPSADQRWAPTPAACWPSPRSACSSCT